MRVGATTTSGSILTLDDGTIIKNGTLTIAGSSKLDVESSTGATLDGVAVTGTNAVSGGTAGSTIEVGTTATTGTILTLDNGTTITNGNLIIDTGNTLDIENLVTGTGATLIGVNVMNSGTIQVDKAVGASTVTLVLDGGTTVTGGTLLIHVPGSPVEGIVEIGNGGATLDNVTVTNNNILTIDPSVTLKLDDNTAIKGGTLTIAGGSTLDVESSTGATLDGVAVTGTGTTGPSASTIAVGATTTSGSILTLDDGTIIKKDRKRVVGGKKVDLGGSP